MTDAHCHVPAPGATRRFICPLEASPQECDPFSGHSSPNSSTDVFFWGIHPWYLDSARTLEFVRDRLFADPRAGVGEIGLDRLRDRTISTKMRDTFVAQLELAAEFHRPVVLHGAKCWGQVVETVRPYAGSVPAFLFHGFSRSDGLLPDIMALNGYVSVGPAVLNDHAVNYRALVAKIPLDRLLLETDATAETLRSVPTLADITAETPGSVPALADIAAETPGSVPALADIAAKVAEIRGLSPDALVETTEANASCFARCLLNFARRVAYGQH